MPDRAEQVGEQDDCEHVQQVLVDVVLAESAEQCHELGRSYCGEWAAWPAQRAVCRRCGDAAVLRDS